MKYLAILIIITVLGLIACQPVSKTASVLEPAAFQKAFQESNAPYLLDVRTPEEVAQGNIEGHMHIDFFEDNFEAELKKLDNSRPVFVYCKSGGRSGKTAAKLEAIGFKEIYDLKGGYTAWNAANKE